MLIHSKDDIRFVTEFPCFLGHPVSTSGLMDKFEYIPVFFIPGYFPLILSAYIKNSLLIKDIKRLWHIHTVQTSSIKYAFGVQVYGEVLYLKFYLVFSEPYILLYLTEKLKLCQQFD